MATYQKPSAWLAKGFCALAILLSQAALLSAQERSYSVSDFYSSIAVLPDRNVDVTENIIFQFIGGPWDGIYRSIPVHDTDAYSLDWSPLVNVKSVTDESKNKLKFETSGEGRYLKLKIYIPHADNSTRTMSIKYTMSNALKLFNPTDEPITT
jgi:hypothetical protein